ncbi:MULTISPECIES: hypothetical protein [unclassified Acinetobacter]|uniref:hypothetical protein n=1 Tax=unclassified Acinetobacter TaxID=196816 RepID=UPI0035BB574B
MKNSGKNNAELKKEAIRYSLIENIGTIALALGLFTIFGNREYIEYAETLLIIPIITTTINLFLAEQERFKKISKSLLGCVDIQRKSVILII